MKVIVIAALCKNNALGKNNELLFRLKSDMQNFRKLTTGNIVVMGSKTFKSMNSKPLPNRLNIVLSRKGGEPTENLIWATNLEETINSLRGQEKDVYIIGGGQIYRQALESGIADEMLLTHIDKTVDDADTFFPEIDKKQWKAVDTEVFYENGTLYEITSYEKNHFC